ncbi:MAG: DUF4810 domain-containing protein [Proteobacteria bacterium]|nr:DUF4810 domain-containing protein [Pseudomonadota bacterium]
MNKLFIGVLFGALFMSGCAASVSPANLYWGNYSETLYVVKKDNTEEAHTAHEKELTLIVEESKKRSLRIPPGVYMELGIYASKRGDKALAENYFGLEQKHYPEGGVLLGKVIELEL